MSDDTGTSSSRPPLRAVKKIQSAGRGKLPNYGEGYRVQLHYEVLKPPASGEWPEDRSLYKSIDSTKRPWPHGYGQPLELVLGKKFQLPILEQLVETMLENEIAQFDVDAREVLNFPLVAKKLRDIAKTRDKHGDQCQHDSHHHHGHSHGVGMSCAAAALSGTGYEELDELLKTPSPLRMIVHLLKVEPPETYAPDAWQLSADEKLASIDGLREKGNEAYRNADYSTAMETYREALGRLETLILREKPGDPEWTSLDERTTPLYLNLAQCLLSAGEYAEANAAATEALQRQPTNEKALYRRIKARMMLWQLDEAELDLQELEKHHGDRCEQLIRHGRDELAAKRAELKEERRRVAAKMFGH